MLRLLPFFIIILCLNINAQVTKEIFESFKLQERRDVEYYFPEDYDLKKEYPLIVVLDGDYLFDLVVANSKFYSAFYGMPQMIVVGVNQSKESIRLDDCAWDINGLPDEKGKKFFEFLGMELIPYIELNYNISKFKMVVGYDITANFQNYWLFKANSLFSAYINISPNLAPEMETRIPERLEALNQKIFYQLIIEGEKNKNTSKILNMNHAIKAIDKESLHCFFDEYPNANHISIATYGIGKAFDNIFGMFKPISPKEYKTQILTSEKSTFNYLESRYKNIKDLFGITKAVDLNDIIAIYAASIKKEDFESLKPLSELCKREYANSMLGFFFEAEYYEQTGNPKKAIKTYKKAFSMNEIDFLTKEMVLDRIKVLKDDFGY